MRDTRPLEFPRSGLTLVILTGSAALAVILLFATVDPWLNRAGILAGGLDVHIYRDGARRILHGLPLYTEPTVLGLLYTYTPFSTIAFIPFDIIPWTYVTNTWLVVNLVLLFTCVQLSWRLLGYRLSARLSLVSALLATSCVFIEPVRTTLFYGQINLMLMLLVMWDCALSERSKVRGIYVGLAGGIKLVPLYFIAQFVALRQWRSAITAVVAFAGSVVLAAAILPSDSRQYWTSTFFQSNRIGEDRHPSNQSIRGVIAHLMGEPAPVWLWLLIAGSVAVLSLAVTVGLFRRGERLLAITLTGLTACAVSPFSWGHHWVWFVPLLVYLVHKAQTRRRWWVGAAALYVTIGAWAYHYSAEYVSIGVFLLPPWWPVNKLLVNAYAIAYLAVLVGAAVVLAGLRRNVSGPPSSDRIEELPTTDDLASVSAVRVSTGPGSPDSGGLGTDNPALAETTAPDGGFERGTPPCSGVITQ